jgi:hypothetical protein
MTRAGIETESFRRPLVANGWAGLSALVLFIACALPMPGPDGSIAHLPSVCLFHDLTGLPCPGCGLTRSFVCLAHGQFAQSLRYHPLGAALFAFMLATVVYAVVERVRPDWRLSPPAKFRRIAPFCALAIFLIAWAARLAGIDPLPGG